MDGAGRGRGRARGRARPPATQGAQPPQGVQPPPPQRGQAARQPPSVVSTSTSSGGGVGRAGVRPQQSGGVQETTQSMQRLAVGDGNGNGNGNGNGDNGDRKPVGRGNVRGGRFIDPVNLYTRPESVQSGKKGSSGQVAKIQANFFPIKTIANYTVYKHHVDYNPAEDRTFMRKILLGDHRAKLNNGGYLFDGSTIFCCVPLCPEDKPLELFSERKSDQARIRIAIKRVGTCERGDAQYLQIFNILVRSCLGKLNLKEMRRNYFDPQAKVELNEFRLELWPGYITCIGQYETDILLQAEITYKVIRKDTAYQLFQDLLRKGGDVKKEFDAAIIGSVVMTTYNSKTYRVDEVSYNENPKSTFTKKTKEGTVHVSYLDYYQKAYSVSIRDVKQPMLISRSSARDQRGGLAELLYLVPELCVMTGTTDDMRSNYQTMRALADVTSVPPGGADGRINRLKRFNQRLQKEPEVGKQFKKWEMRLSEELVTIDGRILQLENIVVGNNKKFSTGPEVDWTKNLRSNKMLLSANLSRWVIVYPARNEKEAKTLFELLQKVGASMQFIFPTPQRYSMPNDNAMSYMKTLDDAINKDNPELVVCLVPNNRADRYSAIKKKCIVDKPVPSQVVTCKSVNAKGNMSIATKIAVQINCKIGGAPWSVEVPIKGLMVIGFDVCHDSRDKRKSYGAMVASLDNTLARYYSTLNRHSAGEELSNSFSLNILKAVDRYLSTNQVLPTTIIVYRDGVGDGNLAYVYEHEIAAIKAKLSELYQQHNQPLKFGFVIVTKRINTRLFHNNNNPPPGTVVDDVITNPFRYDFYLVSQTVRQGTVSPTHYNIIHDSTNLKPDHYQRLTYKLTHMYFNWSGTVRVPAPCQYAHKLAFLTAQSVQTCHSNLDNLLYFL